MEYLFIYGTLLDEFKTNESKYLENNSSIYDNGYFNGKLFNIKDYPGAILSNDINDKVFGKILKLNNNPYLFDVLDIYENINNLEYIREKIKVYSSTNEEINAWCYLYNFSIDNLEQIKNGNYIEYIKQLNK